MGRTQSETQQGLKDRSRIRIRRTQSETQQALEDRFTRKIMHGIEKAKAGKTVDKDVIQKSKLFHVFSLNGQSVLSMRVTFSFDLLWLDHTVFKFHFPFF